MPRKGRTYFYHGGILAKMKRVEWKMHTWTRSMTSAQALFVRLVLGDAGGFGPQSEIPDGLVPNYSRVTF